MMIGIRLLILVAGFAIAVTFLGYLFTKNPKLLQLTKTIIKVTLGFAALIAIVYVLERLFFM
jgi:hypothetical protein